MIWDCVRTYLSGGAAAMIQENETTRWDLTVEGLPSCTTRVAARVDLARRPRLGYSAPPSQTALAKKRDLNPLKDDFAGTSFSRATAKMAESAVVPTWHHRTS
jgi:hypothetical protein